MSNIGKEIFIIVLLAIIAAFILFTWNYDTTKADDSRDYMAEIIVALAKGNTQKAEKLNVLRDAKIDRIGTYKKIDVNDLYLLAKAVEAAGDELTDEQQRLVASEIVNLIPSERALTNSLYVLEGK